jgi:uncharacterized membrane protein YhaH (DUF805 family)
MNIKRQIQTLVGLLLVAGNSTFAAIDPLTGEPTFESLTVGRETFTNVVVQDQDEMFIFIRHDGGLRNIKVSELSEELASELGYAPPEPTRKEILEVRTRELTAITDQIRDGDSELAMKELQARFNISEEQIQRLGMPILIGVGVLSLLIYLFYSYCLHVICQKTETPSGLLVWVPFFQMIPALRAAKMSGWLILLMIVPVINAVLAIVWTVKLCIARGKSGWTALLGLIPGLNMFWLPYLAFSK